MRWFAVIALLVLLVAVAAWMFATSQADTADLRFISAVEVNTLDPQKMSWMHDIRIAECLFEPLVRVKLPEMTIEPGTAERWEVSPDGKTYRFHIRAAARWSNGDPVTAHDFIYAWRRAILPDSAGDYTALFYCVESAEDFFNWRRRQTTEYAKQPDRNEAAALRLWREAELRFTERVGLRAEDDRTLVVRLAQPTAYFLELAAFATFMPIHARSVEEWVHINADSGLRIQDARWARPQRLVTNGPYVLSRWRFKRDMLLEANPHYWNRQAMRNRSVLQLVVTNPNLQLLAYQRGEVDWLPDLPTTASLTADLVKQNRPDLHSVPAAGTYFYIFNCQPKLAGGEPNPLADARLRVALSMGIDRKTIVEKVTRLHQPPARTFVPPGALVGYDPPVEAGVEFSPEQARKLLAQAGYPGGKGLKGLSLLYNTEGGHENIAQQIRRSWQDHLGVDVKLEGVETRIFRERRKNKNFTIARGGWYGDYRDATTFLDLCATGNGQNDSGYSNPPFDDLLRRAATELDRAKRQQLLRDAEAVMLRDQPIAPIYQYITVHLFDANRVQGLQLNAWSLRRLEQVKVQR